jgi:hypothetical protein
MTSDSLMVLSSEIADAIRPWVRNHTRPNQSGSEELARIVGTSPDFIRRLLKGSGTEYTTLAIADKLLAAVERTDLLQDGTVKVIHNPQHTNWPAKMRAQGIDPEELLT